MADPFSVAGSAVGVVALGLEVCKGLVWYIEHVKDQKQEVVQISERLDSLANILENLKSTLDKLEPAIGPSNDPSTLIANAGIVSCSNALDTIREKLQPANGAKPTQGFRASVLYWKSRLAYPFRREDLLFLKQLIRDVQQNLHTALLTLLLDRQRLDHFNTMDQLATLSQSLHVGTSRVEQQLLQMRPEVTETLALVRTTATGMANASNILTAVTTMASSVKQLENRVSDMSLSRLSSHAIEENAQQIVGLNRRLNRGAPKTNTRRTNRSSICHCRPQIESKTIYKKYLSQHVPFSIVRDQVRGHDPDCWVGAYEEIRTSLQLRLSVCSLRLRRKFQIAIEIHRGAGTFCINHVFRAPRVVPRTSPGFSLIRKYFIEYIWDRSGAADQFRRELLKLFDKGDASIYDRLSNGYTLLDWFSSYYRIKTSESDNEIQAVMAWLINLMGLAILERTDDDSTCLDKIVIDNAADDVKSLRAVILQLLDLGVTMTPMSNLYEISELKSTLDQRGIDLEEVLDCNDAVKVILAKSATRLEDLVRSQTTILESGLDHSSMLRLTTEVAWPEGCEILLKHRTVVDAFSAMNIRPRHRTLIRETISINNESILSFWLEQRQTAQPTELELIGSVEDGLEYAFSVQNRWAHLLVSKLVEQRRTLKALALSHLAHDIIQTGAERLPDAQACLIFHMLLSKDVTVHSYLRPSQKGVYHLMRNILSWSLEHANHSIVFANALWKAGFRDVTAADWGLSAMSPLIYHAAGANISLCEWLVSKGANLTEKWPNTKLTAAHILGQAIGNQLVFKWSFYRKPRILIPSEKFVLPLFKNQCIDDCHCGCSLSGCTFATTFLKAVSEYDTVRLPMLGRSQDPRTLTFIMVHWIAPAARVCRDVVSSLIRFLTFWTLEIRHTCCDASQATGIMEDLPYACPLEPRHTSEDLEEILWEDEFLLLRLEDLVLVFEAEYDSLKEDIVDFIMGHWSRTMLSELEELARRDHEQYREGRRHLGIDMATKVDEGNNRFTLKVGLIGKVSMDTRVNSINPEPIVRDVVPTIYTLDELDDIFHEAEEQKSPPIPIS